MTTKKLKRILIAGIFLFFTATVLFIFFLAAKENLSDFRRDFSYTISPNNTEAVAERYDDYEIKNKEDSDKAALLYMAYYGMTEIGSEYPKVIALLDREGNLTCLADNYYYWLGGKEDVYVSLDGYLTDNIRKDLKKIRNNYYYGVPREIRLHYDGEKYIPVEVDYEAQRVDNYKMTMKMSDYEVNKVIVNNPMGLWKNFSELDAPFYYKNYYQKLREYIKPTEDAINEFFGTDFGAMGYREDGFVHETCFNIAIGDGYRMYIAVGYNPYLSTFFSSDFQGLVTLLAIIFAAAGIVFYLMCMKVIYKSEKLDEAKSTFISGASHELKTPLAVIQNQCECIMENVAPEKNEEYISSIYDEALRMNGIVSSLLSYSRVSQLTAIKKEKCNLSELLREEVRNYSKFAQSSGVTIIEDIADDIYADCNAQLMKMAFGNYISNAIKYAVGDKKVYIKLWKNYAVTMEVVNPAEKESADVVRQAWDEFSRGDVSRQRQGVSIGMGLPICKKIFELHDFRGYSLYKDGLMTFRVYIS